MPPALGLSSVSALQMTPITRGWPLSALRAVQVLVAWLTSPTAWASQPTLVTQRSTVAAAPPRRSNTCVRRSTRSRRPAARMASEGLPPAMMDRLRPRTSPGSRLPAASRAASR